MLPLEDAQLSRCRVVPLPQYKLWRRADLEELQPFEIAPPQWVLNLSSPDEQLGLIVSRCTGKCPLVLKMEVLFRFGGLLVDCDLVWLGAMGAGAFHHEPTMRVLRSLTANPKLALPSVFSHAEGSNSSSVLREPSTPGEPQLLTSVLASHARHPLWNASVRWLFNAVRKEQLLGMDRSLFDSRSILGALLRQEESLAVQMLPRSWLEPSAAATPTGVAPSMLSHDETFVAFVDPLVARHAWSLFHIYPLDAQPSPGKQCLWDGEKWRYFHPPSVHGPQGVPDFGVPRPLLIRSAAIGAASGPIRGTAPSRGSYEGAKQTIDVTKLSPAERLALLKQLRAATG